MTICIDNIRKDRYNKLKDWYNEKIDRIKDR